MTQAHADHSMLPMLWPIAARRDHTPDTFTIELSPPTGFVFAPGQFNMLYVPGYGEVPISISGDPSTPERVVHTIRSVGPVTRSLSRLGVGDVVGVRGPFGTSWPTPAPGEDLVLIAGGIGLAPLRPSIYRALHSKQRLFIIHGARSPEQLLFLDEILVWQTKPRVRCIVTVDRGDPNWSGETGVVTKHIERLGFEPSCTTALVCGPEAMIRFAARELVAVGVLPENVAVSLERNMKCGVGQCGHCQLGPHLLCKTGPVLSWRAAKPLTSVAEL